MLRNFALTLLLLAIGSVQSVKLVSIFRHSIKSPLTDSSKPYTSHPLPDPVIDFGAPAGHLTPHGEVFARALGRSYAKTFADTLSADSSGCLPKDTVFAYIDPEQRDLRTAQMIWEGVVEDKCGGPLPNRSGTAEHQLLSEGKADAKFPGCGIATRAEIEGTIGADVASYATSLSHEMTRISAIAGCCSVAVCPGNQSCTLNSIPNKWQGGYWNTYTGGIHAAKSLVNTWIVSYVSNKALPADPKGGTITATELIELGRVTSALWDLYRANAFNLAQFGVQIVGHVAASLHVMSHGITSHTRPIVAHSGRERWVAYVGHDVQPQLFRALLGISWQSQGKPRFPMFNPNTDRR